MWERIGLIESFNDFFQSTLRQPTQGIYAFSFHVLNVFHDHLCCVQIELFVVTSFVSLLVLLGPSALVDSVLYGRPVIAGLNIVLYNVLSEATSSELFVRPPSFSCAIGS